MNKLANKKGIRQLHTIYQEHAEMLIKLVEGPHGFGSGSDVVRKAIVEIYNKFYPPYKGPTYKQKKEEDEVTAAAAITDEEYATDILKGKITPTEAGVPYVSIFWFMSNGLRAFPVEGIKEWAEKNPDAVSSHLELIKENNLDEALSSSYMKTLWKSEYGIILE